MKSTNTYLKRDTSRLMAIILISLFVIVTGAFLTVSAIIRNDLGGAVLGMVIAATILIFAILVFKRGNRDIREGYPLKDERSRRVIEKASSTAFYVSLYLLLGIGFLSERIITFRDVSQATSVTVGGMAVLFLLFWIYYNNKSF
jgi:uncharacterized membrane protein